MKEIDKIEIDPAKLKAARGSMSQVDAAERVGISRQSLCNYENGHQSPPGKVLLRLQTLYGVNAKALASVPETQAA